MTKIEQHELAREIADVQRSAPANGEAWKRLACIEATEGAHPDQCLHAAWAARDLRIQAAKMLAAAEASEKLFYRLAMPAMNQEQADDALARILHFTHGERS